MVECETTETSVAFSRVARIHLAMTFNFELGDYPSTCQRTKTTRVTIEVICQCILNLPRAFPTLEIYLIDLLPPAKTEKVNFASPCLGDVTRSLYIDANRPIFNLHVMHQDMQILGYDSFWKVVECLK